LNKKEKIPIAVGTTTTQSRGNLAAFKKINAFNKTLKGFYETPSRSKIKVVIIYLFVYCK